MEKIRIKLSTGKVIEFNLVYSKRKSVGIQIKSIDNLKIMAPKLMPKYLIEKMVLTKEKWILKTLNKCVEADQCEHLPKQIDKSDYDKALEIFEERVSYYSYKIGVDPKAIKVKDYKSRWGSCNVKEELTFNVRCIYTPIEIIDYVVVHELCHMKQMNHSKKFWDEVRKNSPRL